MREVALAFRPKWRQRHGLPRAVRAGGRNPEYAWHMRRAVTAAVVLLGFGLAGPTGSAGQALPAVKRPAGPVLAPYVPTPQEVVERMLTLAKVTKTDVVIDLGCGDGRIPITAARVYGARGIGVDIDPQRIAEANANEIGRAHV